MADDGRPATRAKTDGDDPAGAAAAADDAGAAESAAAGPAADRSFTTSTLHSQGKLEQKGEIKKLEEKLEKLLTTSTLHSQGKLELKGETETLKEELEKLEVKLEKLEVKLEKLEVKRDTAHAAAAKPAATAKDKGCEEEKEKAATAQIGYTIAHIGSTTAQIGSTTALVNAITEKMTGDILGSPGSASVHVVQAVFKENVQTTRGIREYLYGMVSDAGALKDPKAPYIWYDRAKSGDRADRADPANSLNIRVFFENIEAARGLERHLKEWKDTFRAWRESAPTSITNQMVAEHAAPQQLEITVRGDYNPNESASVGGCSETTASSVISSNAPPSTLLSKYQAVDASVPGWTPHQRLHLIPRELVKTPNKLNRFTQDFWTVANKQFKVTKEQVEEILETYGNTLNNNDSNFIAATPNFHCAFDGLDGKKATSFGSSTANNSKLLVGHARLYLTDEGDVGSADPSTHRWPVKVRFKVLDDDFKVILDNVIGQTDEQKVTVMDDGDLCKTFLVEDDKLFVIALRFKAACNYVAHLSFVEPIGTFANFVTQLNSD